MGFCEAESTVGLHVDLLATGDFDGLDGEGKGLVWEGLVVMVVGVWGGMSE